MPAAPLPTSLIRLQPFQQRTFHSLLMLGCELLSAGGEIEDVDRHLPFGIDQRDFDIAFVVCEVGPDAVR